MANKKALVVGIDDYGSTANALTCCLNDAEAVTRILKASYGFTEVHSVLDRDATLEKVDEELTWLVGDAKPDDRLVFYFSGNGATRTGEGVVDECLALRDGLFTGARLASATRDLAPGVLTAIIDACFVGPSEQFVVDPFAAVPDVEMAPVKVLKQPLREEREKGTAQEGPRKITEIRRFGCSPVTSQAVVNFISSGAYRPRAPQAFSPSALMSAGGPLATAADGVGQLELSGLLVTACLENETAAANTSKTKGLSAFTHAFVSSVEQLGIAATTSEIIAATAKRLRALGLNQTPRVIERAFPGDLKLRRFITLEPITATETVRFLSEPRFWEGVITALAPRLSTARAVQREGESMSTMYQPIPNPLQLPISAYQPGFATQQASPEDIQRIAPVLAPILASVIPTVVSNILSQQRATQPMGYGSFGGASPFFGAPTGQIGPYQQQQPFGDEVQRLLPVLAPILASVIPAVVPPIVNNILAQQRTSSGWTGAQGPSPDLWHTVNQSVNDTLQRMGLHTGGFGGVQTPFAGRV